jgi:hypothetical protein
MKKSNEFKVNDCYSKTINYKRIEITKYSVYWNVSVFDTERLLTTYNYNFPKFSQAKECFEQLIDIQLEKLNYQF